MTASRPIHRFEKRGQIGVNDEGGSIDNGCPVDANLLGEGENPTVGFYDLAALSGLMNEYFGESLAQAA